MSLQHDIESLTLRSLNLPGNLIAIEGLDGSGKTTLVQYMLNLYHKEERQIVSTKFPTSNVKRSRILTQFTQERQAGQVDLLSALAVHIQGMSDRLRHTKDLITPSLVEGKTVICEKYLFGLLAALVYYNLPHSWFLELCEQLWQPNLWVLLYAPAEVCIARINRRPNDPDRNADVKKFNGFLQAGLELAHRHGIMVLDTSVLSVKECAEAIDQELHRRVKRVND